LPHAGQPAIFSPPELNRNHANRLASDNVDDFEVHVRGHDLAVLRSLGPFSDRFIDLTFRDAAENHPLPRMAAIEDAPRHSLQIIRVLLKVTHRMGGGDMMQSSSQASPHNS